MIGSKLHPAYVRACRASRAAAVQHSVRINSKGKKVTWRGMAPGDVRMARDSVGDQIVTKLDGLIPPTGPTPRMH